MNWLVIIYITAVSLALGTFLASLGLVGRRAVYMRVEARHDIRHKALLGDVLEALDEQDFPSALAARMSTLPELASEVLEELLELIRGDNQKRLLQIANEAGMREWLHRRLRVGKKVHRRMAADLLRFFDDEETIQALQRALEDPEEEVRLTATLSLSAIHGGQPLLPILQRFKTRMHSRSLRLRQIFERMSENDQEAALNVALGHFGDDSLRPMAIEALASTAGEQIGGSLVEMAHDPLPSVRKAVISALGNMALPKVSEAVEEALSDESWEVRVAGIEAAKRLDLMDLVPLLSALVEDKVWTVRLHAAEALGKLGDAGMEALRLLSGAQDERSRALAATVLARRSVA
jgi:HEAT repeat protein